MKPISAWHKYALRDEMTTDALNFRELAFRQTSSRPRPSPACSLAAQTTSKASRPPGLAGAVARSSENPPHLRRPLRRGRPPRATSFQPSPRSPLGLGPERVSIGEQPVAASREEPERAGYLPARPSCVRARKTAKRVPAPCPTLPPRTSGSRPASTHAPLHTRARTHTHTHTNRPARLGTPERAHARSHSGCNKGRGQRCLTFLPLLFCGPPSPGPAPGPPALHAPRRRRAAGSGSRAARRGGNFAPGGRETKAAALPEASRPRCAR